MSLLTIKENSFIDNRTLGDIADPKDEAIIFSCKTVEIGNMEKEINNINLKKATINNSNPPKI